MFPNVAFSNLLRDDQRAVHPVDALTEIVGLPAVRNLNYWDSVSTLAGEVAHPRRTFPRALFIAVALVRCVLTCAARSN